MKSHPVSNIFPMMSEAEFKELKDDIAKNGLIEPIWTYKDKIIDGRNRFKACVEVGVKPRFRKWVNNNGSSLVDFVISLNLKRRHLKASQRAMSAVDALPLFEKEAKKRKLSTLKRGNRKPDRELIPEQEKGRSRDIVAEMFGVSGRYIQYGKAINEKFPEFADKIRKGNETITKGKIKLKRLERKNELKKAGKQFKSNHHLKIIHSDFIKWCNDSIEDNSIDLILTDPPYGKEHLELYSHLGELAQRVLKPSKWLITYCNVKYIPEITSTLSQHLTYWWTIALHYRGAVKLKYSTFNSWRPILLFHKQPPRLPKLLSDYIFSDSREKDFHDWQQAQEPIQYLMERFSKPNDLVLDPMAGAGTVLKVSRDLKRKCIAIDKDKECVEMMKGRLIA